METASLTTILDGFEIVNSPYVSNRIRNKFLKEGFVWASKPPNTRVPSES